MNSQLILQKENQDQVVDYLTNQNVIRDVEKDNKRNFYSTTTQLDQEILKKLNNVKNETQKESLKKKMDLYSNENDYKNKLNDIMSKYKNTHKINFSTEINTREFKTILHTIDNIMKTNENNDSNIGGK